MVALTAFVPFLLFPVPLSRCVYKHKNIEIDISQVNKFQMRCHTAWWFIFRRVFFTLCHSLSLFFPFRSVFYTSEWCVVITQHRVALNDFYQKIGLQKVFSIFHFCAFNLICAFSYRHSELFVCLCAERCFLCTSLN